jgi:hypothetical protein
MVLCAASCSGRAQPQNGLAGQPIPENRAPANSATSTTCPSVTPQIRALVDRLDVDADPLHADLTSSVLALAELGLPGACAVLDLLTVAGSETRLHAERVLESVLAARCGFKSGRGFPDQYSEEQARTTSLAIGYAYDDRASARDAGAARWRLWVEHELASPTKQAPVDGPSRDEMVRALDAIRSALVRCGEPVDLHVTFEHSGAISSIFRSDSDPSYQQCVSRAAASVHVRPFHRERVWIQYVAGEP